MIDYLPKFKPDDVIIKNDKFITDKSCIKNTDIPFKTIYTISYPFWYDNKFYYKIKELCYDSRYISEQVDVEFDLNYMYLRTLKLKKIKNIING